MRGRVDELELRLAGRRRLRGLPAQPLALGERTLERDQALGRVGVARRVHARIVLEAARDG